MSVDEQVELRLEVEKFKVGVDRILGEPGSIDRKIKSFTSHLAAFLEDSSVSVFLFEKEMGELLLKGTTVRYRQNGNAGRQSVAGTIFSLAVEEKRLLSLREFGLQTERKRKAAHYVFPLLAEGDVAGVVSVQHVSEETLTERKLAPAREAIEGLAAEINRVRSEEEVSRRITIVSAINEAGVTLISTHELSDLFQLVTAMTALIMGAESCVIRLYDDAVGKFTVRDCYGLSDKELRRNILLLDRKAVMEVLDKRTPVLVRDLSENENYSEFTSYSNSFACFPISSEEGTIGTIAIFNKNSANTFSPSCFTEDDLGNFERLVKYVEKAITNAMAFKSSRELEERDEVTGLPNLRQYRSRLFAEISRARRFGSKVVLINCEASPPHEADDVKGRVRAHQVTRKLAHTIRDALREYDVVARIGEMKFGVILPEAEDGTISAIPRIRRSVEKEMKDLGDLVTGGGLKVKFTQAVYPADGEDDESLLSFLEGHVEERSEAEAPPPNAEEVVSVLSNKPLFFGLSDEQFGKIASIAQKKSYRAGDTIFQEGDPGKYILVLETGEIDIYKEMDDGRKVKLSSLMPGAVIGEVTLFSNESRSATAVAGRDSETICLNKLPLAELFRDDREILVILCMNITRILARRLRKADKSLSHLYALS
jgi:diguanylate cyclase (GGDEF)-like protein